MIDYLFFKFYRSNRNDVLFVFGGYIHTSMYPFLLAKKV